MVNVYGKKCIKNTRNELTNIGKERYNKNRIDREKINKK